MTAARRDLTIEVGAAKQVPFVYANGLGVPYDLTGWGARMQVRKTVADALAPVTLTTANGGIVLDPAQLGRFVISLAQADTIAIAAAMRFGVYDLWLDPDGTPSATSERVLEGEVRIVLPVTR